MNRLSVIVTVYNGEDSIEKTLESLVTQTVEDFEVIISDDGSTDKTAEICRKYCKEYVDFYYTAQDHQGRAAARNSGVKRAKTGHFLFLESGDILHPGSAEGIINTIEKNDADVITGRCLKLLGSEYEYDRKLDMLSGMPVIEKFESSLLWSGEISAKVFSKKLFEHYNMSFSESSCYGDLLFTVKAVMKSGKISGCHDFIVKKSENNNEKSFSPLGKSPLESVKEASRVLSEIYELGKAEILKATGQVDGDEAYCQEIIYMVYQYYIDNFYRKYWYMDNEALAFMKEEFEKYAGLVKPERFRKLQENNGDIRLPYIYTDKNDAASEPLFTIIFDVADENEYRDFLYSLYGQTYPFFEVMIGESKYESPFFPEELKNMENIHVFSDRSFHVEARKNAKSKNCFVIKSGAPLENNILRELASSKIPSFLMQYVFSQKRQTSGAKKALKDKGLM